MIMETEQLFSAIASTPPDRFVENPMTLTYAFKRQKRGWDIPTYRYFTPQGWHIELDTLTLARKMRDQNPHYDHFPPAFPTIHRAGRIR